ncbi:methyltransferase domain-containing protein [Halostella sp. JP-L12]|uniref:class I SAM-dependent methyltransferase n=1 Tax=Halostella TaxID=1843185 RepID=UPI000EF765C9|nr:MULTISPECIES: methyltransferase domain-containing protein [Halostella]NHN46579.1 methyltransferase domain-containing protein [Halostella sp. JP-L12]
MTIIENWQRTRWDAYAPIYDWAAKPFERGRRRAIERLELQPGDRVLVLGCGTGADLPYLPADAEIIALDVAPAMVRRTAERAAELDHAVNVQVGDAGALPFADDAFDAVLLHLVLSVVPDPAAVVAETARVLAPDGCVSIFDKFVPAGQTPSHPRRVLNPVARLLFSDLTRSLDPMIAGTGLATDERETVLGSLYTVTIARPSSQKRRAEADAAENDPPKRRET